ncbi:TSUP family transporter [Motiliproteus sp. MSK22-1]|uniref:TSUP family transporter n=1 Tax=Motiliproteus sp. MSK22-1 TaxID=1897630 RepID=UPI000975DE5A|nr:TSUP family transporter [Motiliproteus sp. MSK22-1]OMH39043.1 permease [Motiliproteus sp. MSK22-1]
MSDLLWYQYLLIGLVFSWSGFVRSGLGFGGAVLALPFMLLIHNEPLVFLPIIAIHLLIFSLWITYGPQFKEFVGLNRPSANKSPSAANEPTIDWPYLKKALAIMIIPKLVGVLGLLTLPANLMSGIIFAIVFVYAIGYTLNKPFKSNHPALDIIFLMLGGYVSGTSLIGAPLIVAVFATRVAKHQLRDTLFVLWFILVCIKMATFIAAGVDLQLIHQLWLLPCATLGHLIGMRFHQHMVEAETPLFYRVLGIVLIIISLFGLWNALT